MTSVPGEVKDSDFHAVDGTGGCPVNHPFLTGREFSGGEVKSRRGRAFGLAYRSWLEFTTNQAASPVYAGKKE